MKARAARYRGYLLRFIPGEGWAAYDARNRIVVRGPTKKLCKVALDEYLAARS